MDALRLRFRSQAKGGDFDYVRTDRVPPGHTWEIRNHSFENTSGTRGEARGLIEGHGYPHWLWEEEIVTVNKLYWSEENIILTEAVGSVLPEDTCPGDPGRGDGLLPHEV